MKVWVEWVQHGHGDCHACPTPNVFTTKENLLEFWRRRHFPSDRVDLQASQQTGDKIVIGDRCAELVEVDEYFVKKAKELAKEEPEVKQ